MKSTQCGVTLSESQMLSSMVDWLIRRALMLFSATALSILSTGCMPYIVGAVATSKSCVDPQFARTHVLNFKQASTKTKVVLLFDTKGRFVGFPKGPFKNAFLNAMKNSGAFSEVIEISHQSDLQKYAGWNVMRIRLDRVGFELKGTRAYRENYQVTVHLDLGTTGGSDEYVYASSLWHVEYGGTTETDETHPLIAAQDKTINQFASEIVLAACFESQRTGRHFQ